MKNETIKTTVALRPLIETQLPRAIDSTNLDQCIADIEAMIPVYGTAEITYEITIDEYGCGDVKIVSVGSVQPLYYPYYFSVVSVFFNGFAPGVHPVALILQRHSDRLLPLVACGNAQNTEHISMIVTMAAAGVSPLDTIALINI